MDIGQQPLGSRTLETRKYEYLGPGVTSDDPLDFFDEGIDLAAEDPAPAGRSKDMR
jgi:hypothetical protein